MNDVEKGNIEIIKNAYEAGLRGDFDGFFANVTDETVFHEPDGLPYGGLYRGKDAIIRGAKLMFGAWDDFTYDILQYGAGGDLVFVYLIISGVGRRTGKSFSFPIVEIWRLKDGKITEIRPFYWDTARAATCFG